MALGTFVFAPLLLVICVCVACLMTTRGPQIEAQDCPTTEEPSR